jgi:Cytochrome P460
MKRRIKITLLILLLSLVSLSITVADDSASAIPVAAPVRAQSDQGDTALAGLSRYRTWTLVNPVPVKMDPAVAALCAAIIPRPSVNPHQNKFISVYVNGAGQRAMMTALAPVFPQGSMIVKEKLSGRDSPEPELLTAMLKREKGYNPESGDWEYLVLDGSASKIVERGRLASCSGCHAAYSRTDFVTRLYLPDDVRQKLK